MKKRQCVEKFDALLRLYADKAITADEMEIYTTDLLNAAAHVGESNEAEAEVATRKKRATYKRRDTRTQPLIDGLGSGSKEELSAMKWKEYALPPGADAFPSTPQGARVWLRNPKHTGGCMTVQFRSDNSRIIRRCVEHTPVLQLGIARHCGVMYRLDAATGWAEPRVRSPDDRWDGEHLTSGNEQEVGRRRTNAIFTVEVEKEVVQELRKGTKSKKIYLNLLDKKFESLSEEEKRQVGGKEGCALLLGCKLRQMQQFAERHRLAAGNGFCVESLAELSVSDRAVA